MTGPLRLGLLGDLHAGAGDTAALERELRRAVERIEAFDPHRTVVLGDLVEDEDPETDRHNAERVVDALAPLSPRYLPGNHDAAHLADAFPSVVGNDPWGHETVAGVELVYLDTTAPHRERSRSAVTDDQLAMLREALDDGAEALAFAHHPVHYHDVSRNPWFGEHPELAFCANKAWVQRAVEAAAGELLATVNGHLHELDHTVYRGADHFTLNAFNKEHPDSEAVTGTHALLTLDERLRVEVFDASGFVREWAVPR